MPSSSKKHNISRFGCRNREVVGGMGLRRRRRRTPIPVVLTLLLDYKEQATTTRAQRILAGQKTKPVLAGAARYRPRQFLTFRKGGPAKPAAATVSGFTTPNHRATRLDPPTVQKGPHPGLLNTGGPLALVKHASALPPVPVLTRRRLISLQLSRKGSVLGTGAGARRNKMGTNRINNA